MRVKHMSVDDILFIHKSITILEFISNLVRTICLGTPYDYQSLKLISRYTIQIMVVQFLFLKMYDELAYANLAQVRL
jgi:hypothetical protein